VSKHSSADLTVRTERKLVFLLPLQLAGWLQKQTVQRVNCHRFYLQYSISSRRQFYTIRLW